MRRISFRVRRLIGLSVTGAAIAIVAVLAHIESGRLGRPEVLTGFSLLLSLVLLVMLGLRRRIPFLPLGSMRVWTQVHIYTGLFAAGVYIIHVPALIAGGRLEFSISLLFVIVTLSGIYGLFASRTIPKRITAISGQHRFDLVHWHRQQIALNAEGLLADLNQDSAAKVLERFYNRFLQPFFVNRPSLAFVVAPTSIRRRRLLIGLQQLDRYLEKDGRETAGALAALVRRRDDLDYQYALQLRLRVWVVWHGVLSVMLLVFSIMHAYYALKHMSL